MKAKSLPPSLALPEARARLLQYGHLVTAMCADKHVTINVAHMRIVTLRHRKGPSPHFGNFGHAAVLPILLVQEQREVLKKIHSKFLGLKKQERGGYKRGLGGRPEGRGGARFWVPQRVPLRTIPTLC